MSSAVGLPRKLTDAMYVPGESYVKSVVNAPPRSVVTNVEEFAASLRARMRLHCKHVKKAKDNGAASLSNLSSHRYVEQHLATPRSQSAPQVIYNDAKESCARRPQHGLQPRVFAAEAVAGHGGVQRGSASGRHPKLNRMTAPAGMVVSEAARLPM